MSQRLTDTFTRLRTAGAPGLVTYVTAGDPGYARSREILLALDRAGADVIELGVPFSEPLADGPVIQRATERALAGGMTLAKTLDLVEELRDQVRAPIRAPAAGPRCAPATRTPSARRRRWRSDS